MCPTSTGSTSLAFVSCSSVSTIHVTVNSCSSSYAPCGTSSAGNITSLNATFSHYACCVNPGHPHFSYTSSRTNVISARSRR